MCGIVGYIGERQAQPILFNCLGKLEYRGYDSCGIAVAGSARQYDCAPEDILVVCDDVDLDLGRLRLRKAGSAGGHRGLQSIIKHVGTEDFPRLRLGIGRPPPDVDMMSYVLGVFRRHEWALVHDAIDRAVQAIETWVYYGVNEAMNRFNRSPGDDVDKAPSVPS